MSELRNHPGVGKLLQLLYKADDQAGLPIVELPESLRDEKLFTACEGKNLIEFIRRKHVWVGGGIHRELRLEPKSGWDIWDIAELHKRARKSTRELLKEVLAEDVPREIRHRVRLTYDGRAEAAQIMLGDVKAKRKPTKRKRGGQEKYDQKTDQKVADAWKTGRHKSVKELAVVKNMSYKDAKKTLDRVRHRRNKS